MTQPESELTPLAMTLPKTEVPVGGEDDPTPPADADLLAPTEPVEVVPADADLLAPTEPVEGAPAGDEPAVAAMDIEQDVPAPAQGQEEPREEDESDADGEDAEAGGSDEEGTDAEAGADTPGPGQPGAKRAAMENEGEIAADYLEELLDIADLDGDIDTFVEAGRPRVSILTEGDMLVGRNGEVLEALQELARLAVMTETGKRSRLMLDIGGHRDKRRKELEALAQDAVAEVRETKESVRLAPMNPFERKIVHDVVANTGLTSESEGLEPQRRVIVLPA